MVTIPGQFNGPLRSGNGGWVCGLLAEEWAHRHGAGIVTSTLRQPPPLDTTLTWEEADDELRLLTAGGAVIATAAAGSFVDEPPPVVTRAEADAGHAVYPGYENHPYDHCFACGTKRQPGDGLRLFTGPIGDNRSAAPWHVHEAFADDSGRVSVPVAWAGLDCPGAWAAGFSETPWLLGRMTAELYRRPEANETLLATGWVRGQDGRKQFTSTALFTEDGDLVGRSEQIWLSIS
ncbi:MAG: hypothetical protein ACJ71Z_06325 [Aeromicrobium sp.]